MWQLTTSFCVNSRILPKLASVLFIFLHLLSPCGRFLLGQKGFRILADFFQIQALVAGTENATAIGLAVEVVGFGHFRRCEEAVVFLEIRRQISVAVLVFDVPADFIDDL